MDEKEALLQLKHGDLGGLEDLVMRYQVRAVHTAYLILQDRSLAEETAQNAFLKASQKIGQFDMERPFAPWFFKILTNDAIKVAHQRERYIRLEEDPEDGVKRLADWLVDPNLLPEQEVVINEECSMLHRALEILSPEQRAVVVMRYFLQISEKEMSTRLKQPLSRVKWWLRAARKRLKQFTKPGRIIDSRNQEE